LTLGAHGVLAEWIDSQANRVQRKSGVNWQVAGMGSGSDYAAQPPEPQTSRAEAARGSSWT
jgi:hypothetical protein